MSGEQRSWPVMPFSFIHAADLHLDSPFAGISRQSEHIARRLRSATFDAWQSLVELCIGRQVSFLLVAGDVFDAADRSVRAQLRFRDGLKQLSDNGIASYIVHGNHDHAAGWISSILWPSGTFFFGHSEVQTVTAEAHGTPVALISGISHRNERVTENLVAGFQHRDHGLFHIGLLHCNVGSNSGHDPYAPCELSELSAAPVDYWALGHVHERAVLHESDPCIVYPGNSQGLSIREQGDRGCYLVNVEADGAVDLEFLALDSVRWNSLEISIDGMVTIDELDRAFSDLCRGLLAEAGRCVVCRLRIVGRGPLHRELRRTDASTQLLDRWREDFAAGSPFLWIDDIAVDTRPDVDIALRREGEDFLSQVLKIADEVRSSEDGLSVLRRSVLAPLIANPRFQKAFGKGHRLPEESDHTEFPSEEELTLILEHAQMHCVDALEADP